MRGTPRRLTTLVSGEPLARTAGCVLRELVWHAHTADASLPSRTSEYMMNMAKKYVIMDTLAANGGSCTFKVLFDKADELHCDVLTAALNSLKRKKAVAYDKEMPLLSPNDNDGASHARCRMRPARIECLEARVPRCSLVTRAHESPRASLACCR